MSNVLINNRTSVHKGSGGVLTTADQCKVPSKCRPRMFTNIAQSSSAAKTASTVLVNGNPACHKDSIFAVSTGDEPGSCGGVKSGTIAQKAEFISWSDNVYIEGKPAVRQFDLMVSNNRNTPPAPLQQPGAQVPPALKPEGPPPPAAGEEMHEVIISVYGDEVNTLKSLVSLEED